MIVAIRWWQKYCFHKSGTYIWRLLVQFFTFSNHQGFLVVISSLWNQKNVRMWLFGPFRSSFAHFTPPNEEHIIHTYHWNVIFFMTESGAIVYIIQELCCFSENYCYLDPFWSNESSRYTMKQKIVIHGDFRIKWGLKHPFTSYDITSKYSKSMKDKWNSYPKLRNALEQYCSAPFGAILLISLFKMRNEKHAYHWNVILFKVNLLITPDYCIMI